MSAAPARAPYAIRRWLLAALLALLAAASLLAGLLTYASARAEIDTLLDEELRQVALSLRDHARLDTERIARSANDPAQRLLVQIDDARGGRTYRSRDVPPLPAAAGEGLRELTHAGTHWRVYALPHEVQTIQVAQPTAQRRALALAVTARILAPLLLLMPLAALLIWWIVGRALRPLDALGRELAQRQPGQLAPLAVDRVPQEAQPLVTALNDLLGRLQAAFARQRALTADAAHALRTPLAAITLQAQLARKAADGPARDAALATLDSGIKRAGHLVAQLLALARMDPDAAREPPAALDLAQLARAAVDEVAPLAAAAQHRLELALPDTAPMTGHADALTMALVNLLDNAVRYTPAGGAIALRLASLAPATGGGWQLTVIDSGPGIAPADHEQVFERFRRGRDATQPGSGLGLAIVREVVRLHGGQVTLGAGDAGRGLAVRIVLPAAGRG